MIQALLTLKTDTGRVLVLSHTEAGYLLSIRDGMSNNKAIVLSEDEARVLVATLQKTLPAIEIY